MRKPTSLVFPSLVFPSVLALAGVVTLAPLTPTHAQSDDPAARTRAVKATPAQAAPAQDADAEASTPRGPADTGTAHVEWTDTGPEAREHPALIHDAERSRVLMLGGSGYAPQLSPLSDLWAFDLRTRAWSRVEAHGDVPSGGGSRRVAQAPGSSHALLFGGYDGTMQPNAELHRVVLRDDGAHFSLVEQHGAPPARFLHGFAWDPKSARGVLYGGVSNQLFGDTWLLELRDDGAHWTQLDTEQAPSPRYGFAYALDMPSRRFVVAGGADQRFPAEVPGDAWALDLDADPPSWSPLTDATLAFGRNPCMAFAPRTGTLVLHGGTANGRDVTPGVHALDLRADAPSWRELPMPEGVPPRASGAGFAGVGGALWLGFGNSGAGAFRDLFRVALESDAAPAPNKRGGKSEGAPAGRSR